MTTDLIKLARIHYECGLIGLDELLERVAVVRWLANPGIDIGDPRMEPGEELFKNDASDTNLDSSQHDFQGTGHSHRAAELNDQWLEFLCLNTWVFTKADPDPYPSVPHGHFKSQNNKWPKLNPYTGRVFIAKHQEDQARRLSKKEMQKIWRDQEFRIFCRDMIIWYCERFPHHIFPVDVDKVFRMPRW
ncbi:hypothetical protein PSH97_21710 [Pseudomonas cucumis]|uniref:Uncharacterized protein n=1 Tax=Pseudomonas cucumis TaxID=2954082 RepID=A0ABY9EU01_9PSED|nr:hypothetical protein [Pseudomonas cucumis]WLG83693.1 hypothetical protein PSH97_21710 [Pseudomonas cucumis]